MAEGRKMPLAGHEVYCQAFSDRSTRTAYVDAKLRHGRLRAAGFCWIVVNRAGRTELMPNESEACVESGSGHHGIIDKVNLSTLLSTIIE